MRSSFLLVVLKFIWLTLENERFPLKVSVSYILKCLPVEDWKLLVKPKSIRVALTLLPSSEDLSIMMLAGLISLWVYPTLWRLWRDSKS
jgi:hypothetical protein